MKKLLLLLFPLATFAQPQQGGGPFPSGSGGSINTNAFVPSTGGNVTNLTDWNLLSLASTGGGQTPLWRFVITDTHLFLTNLGVGIIYDFGSSGTLIATQFTGIHVGTNIGDGAGLSNVTATLPAGVVTNGYKTTLFLGNNLTFTNIGTSVITLSNTAGTTKGTVTSSDSGRGILLSSGLVTEKWLDASSAGVLISNGIPLRIDDGGNVSISNGTVVASLGLNTRFMLGFVDTITNAWTTNTPILLGVTNGFAVLSVNTAGGITAVSSTGTVNDERWGRINITATGNVTFTNPASFRSSDFVTTRVITNGNGAEIIVTWLQGKYTNMYIQQYK